MAADLLKRSMPRVEIGKVLLRRKQMAADSSTRRAEGRRVCAAKPSALYPLDRGAKSREPSRD